jgi:hypothetical protein
VHTSSQYGENICECPFLSVPSVTQRAELLHVLDRFVGGSRWACNAIIIVIIVTQKPTRKSPRAHALKAVRMACISGQACFLEKLQLFKK